MTAPKDKGNGGTDQVLLEENGYARILTLNRPRQLNALSSEMILQLLKFFTAYEEDPKVKLLIMKGKGRTFCAGGDVAAVAHSVTEGHWTAGANFFWNEYILNYIIATYSKPQVSILNGILMGGGAGVSIHGRFRVATEKSISQIPSKISEVFGTIMVELNRLISGRSTFNTTLTERIVFAMPETALGLFPDIGASYFLSRLPGYFGEYVGLTGVRLDGAEMLACGLATHFVPSMRLGLLEESLLTLDSSDPFTVCAIIDQFSQRMPLKESSAYNRLDIIDRCFSKRTVEEILSALEQEAVHEADEWISAAIESLKKASPISLKISLRSISEGRLQGIGQCLIREYRMCCHVLRKEFSKDFFEGCRAILVDKDKNPKAKRGGKCHKGIVPEGCVSGFLVGGGKWLPSKLDLIDDEMVDRYFSKVDDAGWEDLKLPGRRGSVVPTASKL